MSPVAINFNRSAVLAENLRISASSSGTISDVTRARLRDLAQVYEEVARLRQGLWDIYGALGQDTDGDPTPAALVGDIVKLVLEAAETASRDYANALAVKVPPTAVLEIALEAIRANDKWHVDYDEHDGYDDSELMSTNHGTERILTDEIARLKG